MLFKYKGYYGTCELWEDGHYWGKLVLPKDSIIYEASSEDMLFKEFKGSVDEYLEDCVSLGKLPEITVIKEE